MLFSNGALSLLALTVVSSAPPRTKLVATTELLDSSILGEAGRDHDATALLLFPGGGAQEGQSRHSNRDRKIVGSAKLGVNDIAPLNDNGYVEADAGILTPRRGRAARIQEGNYQTRSLGSIFQSDETTPPTTSSPSTSPSMTPTTASPSTSPSMTPTTAGPSFAPITALPTAAPTYSLQCPVGYVDCVNGYLKTNNSTSCKTACMGSCCSGDDACTNFTGKICKDGSCNIASSCDSASIPLVVNSCKGKYACYYAERVESIVNSCNGYASCYFIGLYSPGTATRHLRDSCNGYGACVSVAYNGSIGNITSSCNGKYACYLAGSPPPNGTGSISYTLTSCCNGLSACDYANDTSLPALCFSTTERPSKSPIASTPAPTYSLQCPAGYVDCVNGYLKTNNSTSCKTACLGSCCSGEDACTNFTGKICKDGSCSIASSCYQASIPLVVNSCKGEYACYYAERVESIVNSCNGNASCYFFGLYSPGTATRHLRDSCNGYGACVSVAYNGSIGNITSSCNGKYACYLAGSPPPNGTGSISYTLKSCCNGLRACDNTNDTSLPALCFSTTERPSTHPPTASPTAMPSTANPTASPTAMPSTAMPSTAKPSTAKPSISMPPTVKPSTAKPSTAKPSTAMPSTAKPSTAKPSTAKPSTAMPSTAKPSTAKPSTAKPSTAMPSTAKPSTAKPSTAKPSTAMPSTAKPSTAKPSTAKPSTTMPSTVKPSTAKPSTAKPSTAKPSTANPSTAKPSTAKPSTTKPSAKPSTSKPI